MIIVDARPFSHRVMYDRVVQVSNCNGWDHVIDSLGVLILGLGSWIGNAERGDGVGEFEQKSSSFFALPFVGMRSQHIY
jgi:hypothetical protein